MKRILAVAAVLSPLMAAALSPTLAAAQAVPAGDHHQHLFSPELAALVTPQGTTPRALTARDLVAFLDSAGIRRSAVLSTAYMYGSPARTVADEYAKVRADNDWTAAQAAEYRGRLRALCSFNPLEDYALEELERCARHPGLRTGIKLHFGNSDVQLDSLAHLERMRQVFRAANAHRMAIVAHVRASISRNRPYGPAQARLFLDELLPLAPDVPVQVAHMAGSGPGYNDPRADSAMAVLAEAVARRDPRTRRLWFDVASCANGVTPEQGALLARRIRQVGVERILYGSDAAAGGNLPPREAWAAFRRLPLTERELRTIARNLAPYLR